MNSQRHYTAAISAFIMWGFFSIPLRALREYSAGEILYFRIALSLVVLVAVIAIFRKSSIRATVDAFRAHTPNKRISVAALTLVGGALLTVNWLTFIYIVNNINIKTASFSYLICPVITAALGVVLIRESMTRLQWIAVLLCTISCILIGLNSALELGYSFLTALTYALYLISQRKNQGFDRMVVLCIQVCFSLILLSAIFPLLVNEVPASGTFYGLIFLIAVLFTVVPLFLNLYALNRINSATIGILMYINPIINFTVAFVVFKENITALQLVGYVIIFIAVILFNLPYIKRLSASVSIK